MNFIPTILNPIVFMNNNFWYIKWIVYLQVNNITLNFFPYYINHEFLIGVSSFWISGPYNHGPSTDFLLLFFNFVGAYNQLPSLPSKEKK